VEAAARSKEQLKAVGGGSLPNLPTPSSDLDISLVAGELLDAIAKVTKAQPARS
jgi:hypothetical protein